jgi:hypothetical protein
MKDHLDYKEMKILPLRYPRTQCEKIRGFLCQMGKIFNIQNN